MPQRNRGKHPNDDKLFNEKWQAIIKEAVFDLSYLLTKGYGEKSALQLVGGRYRLNSRQQKALMRLSGNRNIIEQSNLKTLSANQLKGKIIEIDGFNLLILLESALSGAYLFKCLDGNYRDISSVHGSYKRVIQTEKSIELIGNILQELQVKEVLWLLDSPVSNSGRLKQMLYSIAEKNQFPWEVELVHNPDTVLAVSENVVVTADAWILDKCKQWFNFNAYLIENQLDVQHIIYAE